MADPRLFTPAVRQTQQERSMSPLMRARSRATDGVEPNFCPFECDDNELDEHGICRHVVGFTDDKLAMEPLEDVKTYNRETGDLQVEGRRVNGSKKMPVLKDDRLVQITTSYRVYRDVKPK